MWLNSFSRLQTYVGGIGACNQVSFLRVYNRLLSDTAEKVPVLETSQESTRVKISVPFWAKRFVAVNFKKPTTEYANVKVSEYGETFPGLPFEAVVLIEGEKDSVLNTVHKISSHLRSFDTSNLPLTEKGQQGAGLRQKCVNLIVPNAMATQISGKRGENLYKLKHEYSLDRCQISARNGLHNFGSESFDERAVYIGGESAENLEKLVNSLIELVEANPGQQLNDSLLYKDICKMIDSWTKVKVLVPFYFMPGVVKCFGKAKVGSKNMVDEYGVKLISSRYGDFYPRTRDRVVIVEGPNENVLNAVKMISNSIRSSEIPSNLQDKDLKAVNAKQNSLRFVINTDVIAENFPTNETQEDFNDKHGVQLHVKRKVSFNEKNESLNLESIVTLNGSEDDILEAAKDLISKTDYRKISTNLDFYGKYGGSKPTNVENETVQDSTVLAE